MHYTRPSKGLKFQLVLSTSLWEHDQHHRETAVKLTAVQDAMQILEGRREGRKATFIYLLHFFLAILYTSDWHQYFLRPSHYSLQLVEKIEFFSPILRFCLQPVRRNHYTLQCHYHSLSFFFLCTQCFQLLCPFTVISIPLNSYWCLLFSASMQKG